MITKSIYRPVLILLITFCAPLDAEIIPSSMLDGSLPKAAASSEQTSQESQEGIEKLRKLNGLIWEDGDLWEQNAQTLAGKLGIPAEGEPTKDISTYRSYGTGQIDFDGIRPASASLIGSPEQVAEINLVFINQGDFFGAITDKSKRAGVLFEKERDFKKLFDEEEKKLKDFITKALDQEAQITLVGTGNLREKVHRWDVGETSLLLAVLPDQYIALRIWPKALAEADGRPVKLSATELREALKSNVEQRDNGDVVIDHIPMINQGPKGYCVPATYERLLRYFGLSADMYSLANAGKQVRGSGTYVGEMNRAVDGLLSRSSRRIQGNLSVSFPEVCRWIDRGVPLIWTMYVSEEIEGQSNDFTRQRATMSADDWRKEIRRYQTPVGFRPDRHGVHVRMITGYNKQTNEIAYSDSWGPEFKERWMPFEAMRAVTLGTGGLQVITW